MTDQARTPKATPSATPRACPICGKPVEQAFRPFCSARCRDVDLNRWLTGRYVVPGREDDAEDPE
ncbi:MULTISPECIES: DNA gyrase inhibitor YacG [Bradyrhizobium]|uniref:DNA gyrase inhibitor YacG n=1 Tax=Bradyrhizobium TaxID=374 RepID=UPI0008416E1B|nr:DNA gyrase inhibitor YacG [Bradyrhizobium elkanii]ODM70681.1 DNA gyrase inhibitor [Bradyrhizobium elkanii]ODM80120.1 DNA gyrase inhibitor [Bradyrhizobium elkanii]WLA49274.1 DNA gyrase inhibitor YacG [Bradyrhizobium elkanii]WLB80492.1 DNA gyrase inhibitor YacG [Bradyrhizobium elkanii]